MGKRLLPVGHMGPACAKVDILRLYGGSTIRVANIWLTLINQLSTTIVIVAFADQSCSSTGIGVAKYDLTFLGATPIEVTTLVTAGIIA